MLAMNKFWSNSFQCLLFDFPRAVLTQTATKGIFCLILSTFLFISEVNTNTSAHSIFTLLHLTFSSFKVDGTFLDFFNI